MRECDRRNGDCAMQLNHYTVTYAFDGYLRGESSEAVPLITGTVTEMQRDGIAIEFLGATQEIDAAGQLVEVTARYAAPSKGTIGRLNCRARLPASGPPRRESTDATESTDRGIAVAGH